VRVEAPVVGELLESGIPDDAPVAGRLTDGARSIVQMLAGVAAEVLEGALVSVEELAEGLPHTRLVEAAPRIAEGHDEHVQNDGSTAVVNPGLAPSIWLCWPGGVSKRTVARSAAHFGHRDHSDRAIVITRIGGS
jgi:hypothetical protein